MAAMNTVISVADAVDSVSKTRSPMRRTAFGVAPLSTPAGAAAPLEFTVTGWVSTVRLSSSLTWSPEVEL